MVIVVLFVCVRKIDAGEQVAIEDSVVVELVL
jgi:hypothetical protein